MSGGLPSVLAGVTGVGEPTGAASVGGAASELEPRETIVAPTCRFEAIAADGTETAV